MARRFQRTHQGPRRQTDWVGGVQAIPIDETTLAGQTAVLTANLDTRIAGNAALGSAFTVVRVRGILSLINIAPSTDRFAIGAFGICIVNGEAFDAGVASIISPWSESFDDRWLYHTYWSSMCSFNASDTTSNNSHIIIDGKSMRKMSLGDVLVAVMENASTDSVKFFSNFRTLIKLT